MQHTILNIKLIDSNYMFDVHLIKSRHNLKFWTYWLLRSMGVSIINLMIDVNFI
jgi:hypothetical protein